MRLPHQGYRFIKDFLSKKNCDQILTVLNKSDHCHGYNIRNPLIKFPEIQQFLCSSLTDFKDYKIIRSVLFRKPVQHNWKVPWHQDRLIQVKEKFEQDGYQAWSIKEGINHVQPPLEVMESIISLRIHLTDCSEMSGPLRIIPSSHKNGYGEFEGLNDFRSEEHIEVTGEAGDALIFSPLLLHSSQFSSLSAERAILHLELSNYNLKEPIQWFKAIPIHEH